MKKTGWKFLPAMIATIIEKLLSRVHDNLMAVKLSKILGQAVWERNWILKDSVHDKANDKEVQELESRIAQKEFLRRYRKSYL